FARSIARAPHASALFPYTTLFRSTQGGGAIQMAFDGRRWARWLLVVALVGGPALGVAASPALAGPPVAPDANGQLPPGWVDTKRSEEHTSELQSRENLVCRLLLEK